MAELTTALKTARGTKRMAIIKELQKRYDELVPLKIGETEYLGHTYTIRRFNFELCYL